MLTFEQMVMRLGIAILLGAVLGLERESVGKEAGVRTEMLVASGACIFTMIALVLPYIVATDSQNLSEVIARNSGFLGLIANIVVGIGFLGAGIIFKTQEHVHGITTAAVVWATAAVGTLVGIGLISFAATSTIIITALLYVLRRLGLYEKIRPGRIND